MPRQLHISLSSTPRPQGSRVLFFDGPADATFRPGLDIELSHWLDRRTPPRYRADTGTEVCLRFTEDQPDDDSVLVNNHVGVDGILSAYVLLRPQLARVHHKTLVEAARMGDFQAWGEPNAQVLFQGITLRFLKLMAARTDAVKVYEQCLETAGRLLGGLGRDDPEIHAGMNALAAANRLVEAGQIQRRLPTPRLAQYTIPASVVRGDVERALNIPAFNAPLTDTVLLPPQVRDRLDRDRVQLVSVEAQGGWYHDLFYPWHSFADTPQSWRPPGVGAGSAPDHCVLELPALHDVAADLQKLEKFPVEWVVPTRLQPFKATMKMGRRYPVVLCAVDAQGKAAPSSLHPQQVGYELARIFVG